MDMIIITAEYVSALFLLIITVGTFLGFIKGVRKVFYFECCLISTIFSLCLDATSYLYPLLGGSDSVTFTLDAVSFLLLDVIIAFYICHLYYTLQELNENNVRRKILMPPLILCGIDMAVLLIEILSGYLFRVENGVVIEGPLYNLIGIVPIIYSMYLFIYLAVERKRVNSRIVFIAIVYTIIPLFTNIITIVTGYSFVYCAISLSLIIMYIMMQSTEIESSRLREKITRELSTKDTLTGLYNRRAYDTLLNKYSKCNEVGTVFFDLNGLKYTNDNYGHEEGDRLLQNFTKMLLGFFDREHLCRISGDEFIAFIDNMSEETFGEKIMVMKKELSINGHIAACGGAFGEGKRIRELIIKAEDSMYSDKKHFYETTGRKGR